jgi:hypothetical protein
MPSDHARRVDHLLEMQSDPAELALCEAEIVMYDLHQTKASGGTYLVVFKDDSCAYHKRHDELNSEQVEAFAHNMNTPPMHECAAWHFAKALGPQYQRLLPVTVYRKIEGKWGSLAAELPGTKPAGGAYAGAPDQVDDAGLFDVLIGQQDRHLNNFLWDANGGRLGLFDHAFAFPAAGHKHRIRSWQLQRQRRYKKVELAGEEVQLIERVLASGDLLGIEPLLEPERAEEMKSRLQRLLDEPQVIPKVR